MPNVGFERQRPKITRAATRRAVLLGAAALAVSSTLVADEGVPLVRQAELVAKVAPYDRAFAGRAGDAARVLVTFRDGDGESVHAAKTLERAFSDLGSIGGLPVQVSTAPFKGAAALAQACRDQKIAIVYVGPKLLDEAPAIATALSGGSVLSVGGDPDYVAKRIVLGFELVSGKPKLVVHLEQAKAQGVAFKAEVLKLMRVIE